MSYDTIEESADSGTPVELYEIVQGTSRWNFISGAMSLLRMGQTYQPMPISRDRIKQSSDIFKDSLKLTFPRGDSFASQFLGFAPEDVTTVTVLRGHIGDPSDEYIVYWKGRVVGAKVSGNTINVECESVFTSIKRPGLRARFEYGCRHALYLNGCNVSKELYRVDDSIFNITRGIVIVALKASLKPDGYYTGGILTTRDGTTRFIVNHTGNNLELSRPMRGVSSGTEISMYPGCDHLLETCHIKFNNLDNNGSFPFIPSRNPFNGSSIV